MLKNFIYVLGIVFLFFFSACQDGKTIVNPPVKVNPYDTITDFKGLLINQSGTITVNISHVFKDQPLKYDTIIYINAANDTFNIEKLAYRISDFTLYRNDTEKVNMGDYELNLGDDPGPFLFTLKNVPAGVYSKISFLIGVDSISNHTGPQTGNLDPAFLYWNWNDGYIFFRLGGRTPSGTTYNYDIGGDINLVSVQMDISSYKIKSVSPTFRLKMDVNEVFQSPQVFSMKSDGYSLHFPVNSPSALKLAANMKDVITLTNIQ